MQDFLDGDGGCANPHGVDAKLLFGQFSPKTALKQDSIPVGCVPQASVATTRCQYWWGGRSRVSSDDHQMSVAGSEWEVPCLTSRGRGVGTHFPMHYGNLSYGNPPPLTE